MTTLLLALALLLSPLSAIGCGPFGTPTWHEEICEGAVCGSAQEIQAWLDAEYPSHDDDDDDDDDDEKSEPAPKAWQTSWAGSIGTI